MIFLINHAVVYDSLNGTLRSADVTQDAVIELTTVTNQILKLLILHQGELVSREKIFEEVWVKEGASPSSNTLNQYISVLRKHFTTLLGESDVITTVPRAGYTFNTTVTVETQTKSVSRRFPTLPVGVALMLTVALLAGYLFIPGTDTPLRHIGDIAGCPIYDLSEGRKISADGIKTDIAKEIAAINGLTCPQGASFYVYVGQNKPARVLLSKCEESGNATDACKNYYYYKWPRS
nr:helix-turn-helix domain-containing protein [uncultured Enterobacter sp.]